MDNDTDLTHTVIEMPTKDLEEETVDNSNPSEEIIKIVKTLGAVTALTLCVLVHNIILCHLCVIVQFNHFNRKNRVVGGRNIKFMPTSFTVCTIC